MKILTISNLFPPHGLGGYEERCRTVCRGLHERGHEVTVLTSQFGSTKTDTVDGMSVYRELVPIGFFDFPWVRVPKLFDIERTNATALTKHIQALQPDVIHIWNMGGISKGLLQLAAASAPTAVDISDHWVFRGLPNDPYALWCARHPIICKLWPAAKKGLTQEAPGSQPIPNPYFTSQFSLRDLTASKGFFSLS